jgi:hypothetical protein
VAARLPRLFGSVFIVLISFLGTALGQSPQWRESVTGSAGRTASVSTSTNVTATANHLYLAAISTKPNVAVSSVSGLGLNWTMAAAQCGGRGLSRTEVWKAIGTPSGNGKVTATLSAVPAASVISVSRYSGTDLGNPIGTPILLNTRGTNGACSGGSDTFYFTTNATTTVPNATIYAAVSIRQASFFTGLGYVERSEVHSNVGSTDEAGLAIEDQPIATPGTNPLFGLMSAMVDYGVVGFELKPPSASTSLM